MSQPFLTEAGKVFRQTLEGEVQRAWGDHLTKEHQAHISFILASAASVYFDSVEKTWCIANQDRISVKFRGFVDSILRESFDPANAFVVADSIADISADIFNQLKVTINHESEEGPDNEVDNDADICENEDAEIASNGTSTMAVRLDSPGPDSIAFESESEEEMDTILNDENNQGEAQNVDTIMIEDDSDKENRPVFRFAIESDEEDEDMAIDTAGDQELGVSIGIDQPIAKDTPAAVWTGLGEEEDENVHAVNLEDRDRVKKSFNTSRAVGFNGRVEADEDGDNLQQAEGKATKKGKGPQRGPQSAIDHFNNALYSVVLGENSSWPPTHYKCKIDGCGKQGAWRARPTHFKNKHAEQWREATGCVATEHPCPVPGCSYTSPYSNYIPRHLKRDHPGYKAAPAKNGRKNKRC